MVTLTNRTALVSVGLFTSFELSQLKLLIFAFLSA